MRMLKLLPTMFLLASLVTALPAAAQGPAAAGPGHSLVAAGPVTRLLPTRQAQPTGPASSTGLAATTPTGPVLHDTHTVTSTQDSGPGSLRQALFDAGPGDTIGFSLTYPVTITLTSGELAITKSLILLGPGPENLAVSGNGASRVFAISGAGTTVALSGLTVAHGSGAGGDGGGIYNGGTLTVTHATFSGNGAGYGGGIMNNGGALRVTHATFSGNGGVYGGGIYNWGGTLTVSNATFSGNRALGFGYGSGGGIYNSGTLTMTHATFSGNWADGGGGISNGGTLAVTNATFYSNHASNGGGGISNGGTLTVTNATFSGNQGSVRGFGGGIRNHGTLYLRSTIVANSTGGGDCYNDGTIGQNVNNLIEDGSCDPLYSGDPNLGPLGDYGGDTWTYPLISPSLAIDHGDSATCPPTDQRGVSRPQGPACDIGAFEGWFPCEPAVTVTSTADSGADTLRNALAYICPGGTIDFALAYPATITLTSGQLDIAKSLTILGPGAENLTVSGNGASRVFSISGGASVALSGLTVADGNSADGTGGGIYNGGTLMVTQVTFSGNTAGWYGGGIYNGGTLMVTHATFSGNDVTNGAGGGITNEGTLTVTHATFSGNLAYHSYGGGIHNAGTLTVTNATFSGNGATWGGGIWNGGTLTLTNATFSGNGADNGGGIYNESTLYLRSTIVANSTGGGDCYNDGTIGQNAANLIEDGSCDPLYSGDPNLGPLGDYGGDTWTHPLISPSLAIDHGDPATCPATDQRGYSRHGPCDIGAFEYNGGPPPCTPVDGAGFSWLPLTPTVGQAVTFTGTVAAGHEPISYTWKMDDGSWQEGRVVTHSYDLPGAYAVVMTATNCATATATVRHTLTVVVCPGVSDAGFTWAPAAPEVGQAVTFTAAASSTRPLTYTWKLDVGCWMEGQVVTHTYDLPGLYTVTLTATNDCDSWQAVTDTLSVPPTCQGVSIVSVMAALSGCMATLDAELIGSAPFTYLWDLGPLGAYSDASPVVDFQATGTYTGTLNVWNCGNTEPATNAFTVEVTCREWYFVYLPLALRNFP